MKKCVLYAGIMAMALLGACSDNDEPAAEEGNDEYAYLKDIDATAWANEVSQELHGGAVTVTLMACDEDFNPKNDFREDESVCFLLKYKNNTDKDLVLASGSMGDSGVSENIYFPYQNYHSTKHEFFMCLYMGEDRVQDNWYYMPLVADYSVDWSENVLYNLPAKGEFPSRQHGNWKLSDFVNYFVWPAEAVADPAWWKKPPVEKGVFTAAAKTKGVVFYEWGPASWNPDVLIPQEAFSADIDLSVTFVVR